MSVESYTSDLVDKHVGTLPLSDRKLSISSKIMHAPGSNGGAGTGTGVSSNTTTSPNAGGIVIVNTARRTSDIASGTSTTAPRDVRHTGIIRTQDLSTSNYQSFDEPDEDEYNIHIGNQQQRIYTDDHPEPELLPTVVGKDSQGRIIPSTSTISLLSLNQQQQEMSSPKMIVVNNHQQQQPVAFIDRKNSFGQLRNLLSHKRLQPYQKLTSPSEYTFTTTTNTPSIPIQEQSHILQPPSPNLDPVSLGGSPSGFWLTSSTPPKSRSGSRTQLYQMQYTHHHQNHPEHFQPHHYHVQKQQQFHPLSPIPQQSRPEQQTDNELYIDIEHKSVSHSPTLDPVQTPAEDPPMTPLSLNRVMNGYSTDYFNLDTVMHNTKKEEEEETNGNI
ncbi:hypothetical protein JA1_001341 [Spathaspora sp. JA1]|nr:hypothetical protein JA1_001341 [Spathaspora sp. JA1]